MGRNDNEEEAQLIEDALCPPDDPVELALSKLIGLESVKNQVRGLRRSIEIETKSPSGEKVPPYHIALQGNPGTGKPDGERHYHRGFRRSAQGKPWRPCA